MIGFFGIGFFAGAAVGLPVVMSSSEVCNEQLIFPGLSKTSTGQPSCVQRESKPMYLPAFGWVTMYSSVSKSMPLLTGISSADASGVLPSLTSLAPGFGFPAGAPFAAGFFGLGFGGAGSGLAVALD